MLISTTLSSLTLGAALLSGAAARLAAPRAASTITGPQINCTGYQNDGPYMFLSTANTGALPGFNATYMLSDALTAAGSSTVPATDYEVLQDLGPFSGDGFQFRICSSTYMKYPASSTTNGVKSFFGHIQPSTTTHATAGCVTRTLIDGHQFLVDAPCRYNDDAGQEAQWFQLATIQDNVDYQEVSFNLTLISAPKGTTGTKYHFKPGTAAAPAIQVGTASTGYQLGLEYIHIN